MGKGDKKSKRGKLFIGSYGIRRRRKKGAKPTVVASKISKEKEAARKKPVKGKKEPVKAEVVEEVNKPSAAAEAASEKPKTRKPARDKKETKPVKAKAETKKTGDKKT